MPLPLPPALDVVRSCVAWRCLLASGGALVCALLLLTVPVRAEVAMPDNQGGGTGTVFYVDGATGNDSHAGTSESAPWKTIEKAIATLVAGQTVLIKNGDYYSTGNDEYKNWNINKQGSAGQYITFKAYPGHRPRLHVDTWNGLQIWDSRYIEINGLEIVGLPDPSSIVGDAENSSDRQLVAQDRRYFGNGISIFGSTGNRHIIVRNCMVRSVGGNGIAVSNSTLILIEGNRVYDSTHRSDAGNSAISVINMNDTLATPQNYGVVIRNNVLFNNRNMLDFKYSDQITDGNGVILDLLDDSRSGAGYMHRTLVANNLIYNNGGRAVHAYYSSRVDFVNNTAYANLRSPDLQSFEGELSSVGPNSSVNFYNNIAVAATGCRSRNLSQLVSGEFRYNLVNSTRTDMGSLDATNMVNVDPQWRSPSPTSTDIYDFEPQAGSVVLDAAMTFAAVHATLDGLARPQGAGYDMGVFDGDSGVTPGNQAPVVHAGAGLTILSTQTASLSGSASDDGIPGGPLVTTWSKLSGPGTVTFANPSALQTTASFEKVGIYTLRLTASDGELTRFDDVVVTVNPDPNAPGPRYAVADMPAQGSVSGSYTDTFASDNTYQALREIEFGTGRPTNKTSQLEHVWRFDNLRENSTFVVEAYHTANSENDHFVFAYSTNGSTYTNMLTVTKTADDHAVQSFVLPAGLTGTVYVRVRDSDRTTGRRVLDTLYVDYMAFLSPDMGNTEPTVTIQAPADNSTVSQGSPVELLATATDSEDGDLTASLVWTSDLDGVLGSGGTLVVSTLSVGTHTLTATVTDSGSLSAGATRTLHVVAPDPYALWVAEAGLSGDAADPLADPDADGLVNLIEYALNLDPTRSETTPVLAVAGDTEGSVRVWRVGYRRHLAAPEVTVTLETSTDLSLWSLPDPAQVQVSVTELDAQTQAVTVTLPAPDGENRFFRLRLQR